MKQPVRVSILDVLEYNGGMDWLLNGPVADAQAQHTDRSAQLDHIRNCIQAVCHYDFLNSDPNDAKAQIKELSQPYQLQDDILDFPKIMQSIEQALEQV